MKMEERPSVQIGGTCRDFCLSRKSFSRGDCQNRDIFLSNGSLNFSGGGHAK